MDIVGISLALLTAASWGHFRSALQSGNGTRRYSLPSSVTVVTVSTLDIG